MTELATLDAFAQSAPVRPTSGNTFWADRYAEVIRQLVWRQASAAPRSQQIHLGPSEIGVECHRQVVAKLVGEHRTNHVMDPWPSIVGTACHTWMEDALVDENKRLGYIRWLPERKVHPIPGHSGTSDCYDAETETVNDWKFLGPTSLAKVTRPEGPPRHYVVQLLLYALGYRLLGLPVRRVCLVAFPRTRPSLNDLFVWERVYTQADDDLLHDVVAELNYRKQWAAAVVAGKARVEDVPRTPSDLCVFCPIYRPQAAYDGSTGCPGQLTPRV